MSQDCPLKTILTIVAFAANAGVSPPDLLRAAGLDPSLLSGPDIYLLRSQEMRVWDEAVRLTGDRDFGVHLAEWVALAPEDHFDVMAFAVRSCPTLGEHYRLAGRYVRLIHEGVYLTLEEDETTARLVHGHTPEQIGPRHPMEGLLALALLFGRRCVGEHFVPLSVHFTHSRPDSVAELSRVFGAPVHHGSARNELVLPREVLFRPQKHAEERLLAMLDRHLGGLLAALPETHRFRDRVSRCVADELPGGEPQVATIAAKMRMSARSLQRRLKVEETTFAEVLHELRRDLSMRYLRDPRISIPEVAFLLGFLDVTAFHRAFKRWTGSTPAEHRRSARRGDSLRG